MKSGKVFAKFSGLKEEMPKIIMLADSTALILSSKADLYYYTTLNSCSCQTRENHTIRHLIRNLPQATREASKNSEPGLIRMIQAAEEDASSKLELFGLELFGPKPFKPVLE